MIAAAVLLAWAGLLGAAVPIVLGRATWPERAPNLGLFVWQAASVSFLASLVLGGLALAVPVTVLSGGLADLVANCVMAVRAALRHPCRRGSRRCRNRGNRDRHRSGHLVCDQRAG
jgi:heme exporter protein D